MSGPFGETPHQLPPDWQRSLGAALDAEANRPRPAWWKSAVFLTTVMTAFFVVGIFTFRKTVSPLELPLGEWIPTLGLLAASLVAGVSAVAPWAQRTNGPAIFGTLLASTVLVTQALMVDFSGFTPKVTCAVWEVACSMVPALVALWASRRYAPRPTRAAILGAAAAALSLSVLQLKCPHRDVGHLVVFHVLPMALVIGGAILARKRIGTTSYAP